MLRLTGRPLGPGDPGMPGSPSSPLAPIGPARPSCPGGPGLPASPVDPLWPFSPRLGQRKSWICGGRSVSAEGKMILLLLKPLNVPYWSKCTWPITAYTADWQTCHLPFLFVWFTCLQNHAVWKKALCDITNGSATSLGYKIYMIFYIIF